jgi:hypothetical protein
MADGARLIQQRIDSAVQLVESFNVARLLFALLLPHLIQVPLAALHSGCEDGDALLEREQFRTGDAQAFRFGVEFLLGPIRL